ncbi:hypothetical protein [Bradyrhizobium sp. USDA 4506]
MPSIEIGMKAANEHWESFIKGATLMLGGNGVGFGGCLTMLKDGVPSIPGLGVFILFFGVGLLGSVGYYATLTISKVELQQAVVSGKADFSKGLSFASWFFLTFGAGGFISAVVAAMYRFASL